MGLGQFCQIALNMGTLVLYIHHLRTGGEVNQRFRNAGRPSFRVQGIIPDNTSDEDSDVGKDGDYKQMKRPDSQATDV
jgi:hypothetical protein